MRVCVSVSVFERITTENEPITQMSIGKTLQQNLPVLDASWENS